MLAKKRFTPRRPGAKLVCEVLFAALRVCAFVFGFIIALAAIAAAAEPSREPEESLVRLREPTPIEDDANLHDVQFVGSKQGWAVGDHGVIWHSEDGGQSWVFVPSGFACPLRSICFLSDRVGWIAGGGTVPFTRQSYGVVLFTNDGGQSWRALVSPPAAKMPAGAHRVPSKDTSKNDDGTRSVPATLEKQKAVAKTLLPRIRRIKFFSLEDGIAVGEGAGPEPSGVYVTEDGGKSWHAMPGKASPGWLAADFLNSETGILAGVRDSLGVAVDGAITLPRFERFGLRNRHAITLNQERSGWLVGDGGLVLRTENDGIVWQAPSRPLPQGVREAFDFRTVCQRDGRVWLAGSPGSTIWHSRDAGRTWIMQRTGQAVPIEKICFASPDRGWAVGALGTISRTTDGGRTWQPVRGDGRRLALLSICGRARDAGLGLIAELSAEQGYRSLVSIVARESDTAEGANDAECTDRFHEAVTSAGGSAGAVGWQLPLAMPDLDRDFDRLIADWSQRTENRLEQVLTGAIVRQLRTWRPNVLIIGQPDAGGPLAQLIGEATRQAISQAADATSFLEHQELAGLEPWQVQKVFVRLPAGTSGQVNVEPFHYLPHVGETTNIIAASAAGLFLGEAERTISREAYRAWDNAPAKDKGAASGASAGVIAPSGSGAGGIFAGISLAAGGPARRALPRIDDTHLEARQKAIQKMRNFAAYSEKMLDDPRRAGQLIAQLPDIARGLSDSEAAWQLMYLAERYQQAGQWELGELALTELIEKHPDQPAALQALERLMQSWGSNEVTWRRLRKSSVELKRQQNRPDLSIPAAVDYADAQLRKQSQKINRTVFNSDDDSPEDVLDNETSSPAPDRSGPAEKHITHRDLDRKQRYWRTRALKLFTELVRRDPALAAQPAVQFSLASLHRQRTAHLKADEIYQRFTSFNTGTPWAQAAAGELWLNNVSNPPTSPVSRCRFASARPVLDGVLSDACWENAIELPLTTGPRRIDDGNAPSRAYLCYDAEHLYFAARLPRAEGVRKDGPFEGKRRHDEDLSDFDRIVLSLDVDRDYVTSFNFCVDQRGCTSDSCGRDESWNPKWFVAVMGDKAEWRVEVAIPLDELAPYVPGRGTSWSLGITRIIPAVGLESWSHPAASTPRPESAGLMTFDAPGAPR